MSLLPDNETRRFVVSACLVGAACRYDGQSQPFEPARELVRRGLALPVCPEQLGGLPTPRVPCEKVSGDDGAQRIMDADGEDRTEAFERGASEAMELLRLFGAQAALLKANSPSCGCGMVYDGTFSGARVPGNGLFAQMLLDEGLDVFTEADEDRFCVRPEAADHGETAHAAPEDAKATAPADRPAADEDSPAPSTPGTGE